METNEWGSMGKALDIQKSLAEDAHRIHKQVMNSTASYDPEVRIIYFCFSLFKQRFFKANYFKNAFKPISICYFITGRILFGE